MKSRTNYIITSAISVIALIAAIMPQPISAAWNPATGYNNNATLALSNGTATPDVGYYKLNATFPIDILVTTHGQNVVGVSAFFQYDPTLFTVVSIDTSASIFTTQWDNSIDSVNGVVKISRSIPTPGVNVTNGKVATLNIRGIKEALTPTADNFNFIFTGVNSQVILDNQLGTNILSGVDNAKFVIDGTAPANVSSFAATAGDSQISLSWTNPASDFAGVTILRKTGSYPTGPTDTSATQVYDGNGTSKVDTGLTNGTTYYYTAYSRDVVVNYSSGAQISAAPRDMTAPSQITTLVATALSSGSVRLVWTAVGDDANTGTATSYDARYSTAAITASSFASATQATGEPTPRVANTAGETMTVTGLTGNTTYYFAIKAIDEGGNASSLSNTPTAKTYKTADLNNDGIVNINDAGIMMSLWGATNRPAADINQDGTVNINDAGIMMSQWG